ncbi:MAG: tetratricopeptide repeat protein [Cytophagaceae bacterium]|nr:MAG: tetratricopeptide repeat protein [Cytophagaceae bacterium]
MSKVYGLLLHVGTKCSTNLQARAALGTLLLQENEFADAAKYLKEAKALQPSFLDVVFNLGVAYMKQNKLDEAEAETTH